MVRASFSIAFVILSVINVFPQTDSLDKVMQLRPWFSSRADVIRILGEGEVETHVEMHYLPNMSVMVEYSKGGCVEGSRVPEGKLSIVDVNFEKDLPLADLKMRVSLKKLPFVDAYDNAGERKYIDAKKGVSYIVDVRNNLWHGIDLYPPITKRSSSCS